MKRIIAYILTAMLLGGCQAAVNDETEPELIEEVLEEAKIPERTETEIDTNAAEDEVFTDFDEILWEDAEYKLAVRDGMAGVYTADGRLYTQLCSADEAVFYPDESGWKEEEERGENAYIYEGLRFAFRIPLNEGGEMLMEYVCTDRGWYTYFTAEVPEGNDYHWYFFESDAPDTGYFEIRSPDANCIYGIYTLHSVYVPERRTAEFENLNGQYILHDGEWYYYNVANGTKTLMEFMPDNAENIYDVVTNDRQTIGFAVKNTSDLLAYYDIEAGKYLTDFEWTGIDTRPSSSNYLTLSRSVEPTEENNHYDFMGVVLDRSTGELLGVDRAYGAVSISPIERNDTAFFRTSDHYDTSYSSWLYTADMKPISESRFTHTSITEDGRLLAVPDVDDGAAKYFDIYSADGELLKTSSEYEKVLFVCLDWIYVVQDGKLCLIDADENIVVEFCEWSENMVVHWMLSGYKNESPAQTGAEDPWKFYYHERNEAGEYVETKTDTYPAGLYFITEDYSVEYGTVGHAREYFWAPETGLVGMIAWGEIGGYAKPVLYLYPEEECDVTITFANPELLTTVYPAYNDGWAVTAEPDGTLTDERGREYYALYWEESGHMPIDFDTGFCVAKENAAEFLEEKLDLLGLTNREANEMIMYWLPILEKNEYSLVYFELTESRETYNSLNINPAPDSMLRIAIHIKAASEYTEIEEQSLPCWEREGFAAVEWGGVVHH